MINLYFIKFYFKPVYSELTVQSENDAIRLMVELRGLKIGNSESRLRVYWNPQTTYDERQRWNQKVNQQLDKSKSSNGSYYDELIEQKSERNIDSHINFYSFCIILIHQQSMLKAKFLHRYSK